MSDILKIFESQLDSIGHDLHYSMSVMDVVEAVTATLDEEHREQIEKASWMDLRNIVIDFGVWV